VCLEQGVPAVPVPLITGACFAGGNNPGALSGTLLFQGLERGVFQKWVSHDLAPSLGG